MKNIFHGLWPTNIDYKRYGMKKILIDNGFKQIANMRHGIYDWVKKNHPVTR
jgi:hypothetical protein